MPFAPDATSVPRKSHFRDRSVVAIAAAIAHAPSLGNGFVLDDANLLVENPFVRTLSGLRVLLRSELFAASAQPRVVPYYRPLSGLLYWTSYQLLGASAPLQHALNVLLHAAVALLLFESLRAHLVRPKVALRAALPF